MQQIDVESAGVTDIGNVRSDNQDQFLVADLTRSMLVRSGALSAAPGERLFGGSMGHLFLVADGMGGHRAGSEASLFAVQYFANAILNSVRWLVRIEPATEGVFLEELKGILVNAHQALEERAATDKAYTGMGTTLTMAYIAWPRMYVVHAGDTRCYVVRENSMRLLTRDHTVAQDMVQKGQLAREELESSHWSNVLVNALGAGASDVYADIYTYDLQVGDTLMLCSDGLNKHVSDPKIHEVLTQSESSQAACDALIQLAKQAGGTDNITVVTANFSKPVASDLRMRVSAARQTKIRDLQDLPIPFGQSDTNAEELNSEELNSEELNSEELNPGETLDFEGKVTDTADFPNSSKRATDEFQTFQ